jgi:GR25 family glycosyltransferase involved in LPS biosynthesis
MNIVIHAGYYAEPWDSSTQGLGGTEQCIVNLSKQFALLGTSVYVVGNVNQKHDKYLDAGDVYYKPLSLIDTVPLPDVLIGVSYLHYLKYYKIAPDTKTIFWLHNEEPYLYYEGFEMSKEDIELAYLNTDHFVCLTEWHKNYIIDNPSLPISEDKLTVIGNGINTSLIHPVQEKEKNSFIYTSHAERGLDAVLSDIEKKYIDGHLHICTPSYGVEYFDKYFKERVEALDNVTYHGNLPVKKLYELMSRMETWYYPTQYNETYCITALEMLAHHVKPLVNPIAGLKDTLGPFHKNITDWNPVDKYIESRDWKNVVVDWMFLIDHFIDATFIITTNPEEKSEELLQRFKDTKIISGQVFIFPACNGHTGENMPSDYAVAPWWKIESEYKFWNRDVLPGEIGCALSHWGVWKLANKNGYKKILVLEEDFELDRALNSKELYTDINWTLLYLGHSFIEPPTDTVTDNLVVPSYTYNTHAYMLTGEGVRLLLEQNFDKYIFPVDEFLSSTFAKHPRKDLDFITKDTRALAIVPQVFSQTSNEHTSMTENNIPSASQDLKDIPYQEFCKRFVTYSARLKEYDLIVDEPIADIFSFPLFTEEFCHLLIEEANRKDAWTRQRHDNYPTTDMLINELGLQKYYQYVLQDFVYPVAIHKWRLEGIEWTRMQSENFIIKYEEDVQGHLSLHHDGATISCVLALNDEYEGGGTWFSRQQKLHKGKTGYISIHPSIITHRHGARPVTKGERYVLVSFCKR